MRSILHTIVLGLTIGALTVGGLASPALALREETVPDPRPVQAAPDPNNPAAVPRATVGWAALGDMKEEETLVNGLIRTKAVFGEGLKALHGQPFTLNGFIIPLEAKEKSNHFLLAALSPSCPFCPPPGAADLVEVRTAEPIAFSYDLVTLKGTLVLDGENQDGVYFRLVDAAPAPGT